MAKPNVGAIVIIVLVVAVVAGFTIYLAGNNLFSVVSQSTVRVGDDGIPYWNINVAPTGPGEQLIFIDASSLEEGEVDGAVYDPASDFTIEFNPQTNFCEYTLIKDNNLADVVASFFSNIFGSSYDVYRLGTAPTRNVIVEILPSKGDTQTINLAQPFQELKFNDEIDGAGTVKIQTLGIYGGLRDCPTAGDVAIIYYDETGEYEFVSIADVEGRRVSRSDFPASFSEVEPNLEKNYLKGHMGLEDIGVGSLTLVADAEYFDVRYIPPTSGKVEIVDIDIPEIINEERASGISISVRNVGNGDGRFKVLVEGENVYVASPSQSIDIKQGEVEQVGFTIIGNGVEENSEASLTFEVCSLNLYGTNNCEEITGYLTVQDEGITPPKANCGNGICEAKFGENALSCAADCEAVIRCELQHESLYKGSCECDPGYEYQEDVTGRTYCAPIDNTEDILQIAVIGAVFISIAIGMILVYIQINKK